MRHCRTGLYYFGVLRYHASMIKIALTSFILSPITALTCPFDPGPASDVTSEATTEPGTDSADSFSSTAAPTTSGAHAETEVMTTGPDLPDVSSSDGSSEVGDSTGTDDSDSGESTGFASCDAIKLCDPIGGGDAVCDLLGGEQCVSLTPGRHICAIACPCQSDPGMCSFDVGGVHWCPPLDAPPCGA